MAQATTGRWAWWVGLIAATCAVITGIFQSVPHKISNVGNTNSSSINRRKTDSILSIFARQAFDWSSSTTPAPLSTTAVLVKAFLANKSTLPIGLDEAILTVRSGDGTDERVLDVQVGPVRDFVSSRILREVQQLCASFPFSPGGGGPCDPNEVDPEFGTTPLHLAELWGCNELVEYLLSIGANPDTYDTVGRQPRNMTFKAFSANSKKAADARLPSDADPEDRCEIPEVAIPLFPTAVIDKLAAPSQKTTAVKEWQNAADAALSEVRRLVSEGEPVMVRNAVPWLQADSSERGNHGKPAPLKYHNAAEFAEAWGHRHVDVGGVPYAKNFGLLTERATLKDYIKSTAAVAAHAVDTARAGTIDGKASAPPPNYVFQVDTEACVEARELLGRVVEAALPSSGDAPIVCPPPSGLRGLESVHYYLGGRWSGAPFHIHSDALNLALSGKKKWWVVPPRAAVWSKRHIQEYAEEGKGGPWREPAAQGVEASEHDERPMECVQRGGDLVYVPGDWGHAAMNLEDETFGYTLELVNRRDTLASVLGAGCEQ